MSVYKDSIYDGLNDAGNQAWSSLALTSGLRFAVDATVRGGLTPHEILGQAAEKITAIANRIQPPPPRDQSWFSITSHWVLDQLDQDIPVPEVVGMALSVILEEATQTSLHLRFENKNDY